MTEVTDDDVQRSIDAALRAHAAPRTRLELAFGRLVLFAESVVLIPDQVPALVHLRDAVVRSVTDVRGAAAPPAPAAFVPHVAAAYAHAAADGTSIVTALDTAAVQEISGVRPTLSLVALQRIERLYRWRTVSAFPL